MEIMVSISARVIYTRRIIPSPLRGDAYACFAGKGEGERRSAERGSQCPLTLVLSPKGRGYRPRGASVRLEGTYGNQKYMQDRTVIC